MICLKFKKKEKNKSIRDPLIIVTRNSYQLSGGCFMRSSAPNKKNNFSQNTQNIGHVEHFSL